MSFAIPGASNLPIGEKIAMLFQAAQDLHTARVRVHSSF